MNIEAIAKELDFEVLSMPSKEAIAVGAYTGDLLSRVMSHAKENNVWITIITNINVIAVASLVNVSAVVIAENAEVSLEVIEKAKEHKVNLLRTDKTAFECAVAINEKINK